MMGNLYIVIIRMLWFFCFLLSRILPLLLLLSCFARVRFLAESTWECSLLIRCHRVCFVRILCECWLKRNAQFLSILSPNDMGYVLLHIKNIITLFTNIFFTKPHINQVYNIRIFSDSKHQIIRFDIPMNETSWMQILNTIDNL